MNYTVIFKSFPALRSLAVPQHFQDESNHGSIKLFCCCCFHLLPIEFSSLMFSHSSTHPRVQPNLWLVDPIIYVYVHMYVCVHVSLICFCTFCFPTWSNTFHIFTKITYTHPLRFGHPLYIWDRISYQTIF